MQEQTIPLVELSAVTKSYWEGERQRLVFDQASLSIAKGEWLFLLGRSGSGKSTLPNLISGIDQPDRGAVVVGGTRLDALSETERTLFRRHHIGFVFQFYNLIPTLTVEDNILLPLELTGALSSEGRVRGRHLLAQVGLAERARSYPDRLSGGEQQRVAVVRALIHHPFLVLADEPTGNLDAESASQVLDLFQGLVRSSEATVVVVTHSLETARLADRVLTISHGQLIKA